MDKKQYERAIKADYMRLDAVHVKRMEDLKVLASDNRQTVRDCKRLNDIEKLSNSKQFKNKPKLYRKAVDRWIKASKALNDVNDKLEADNAYAVNGCKHWYAASKKALNDKKARYLVNLNKGNKAMPITDEMLPPLFSFSEDGTVETGDFLTDRVGNTVDFTYHLEGGLKQLSDDVDAMIVRGDDLLDEATAFNILQGVEPEKLREVLAVKRFNAISVLEDGQVSVKYFIQI